MEANVRSEATERLESLLRTTRSPQAKKAILGKLKASRRADEIDVLRTRILKCRECGLGRQRTRAVPWSGPTHGRADLMVAGEAPGKDEDSKGVPFVGRSGKALDTMLERAGTERGKVFVFNTLCCRPPNNRDPEPGELSSCRPNFDDQLELADVPVGVTLGAFATANVMGEPRDAIRMGEVLNKPMWVNGRIWVPTYHPAYALRNPEARPTIVEGLKLALALRFGSDEPLPFPPWEQIGEIESTPAQQILPTVEKQGWAMFHSPTLGTQVVVTKDEASRPAVPLAVQHLPWYTVPELIRVGLVGKGRRNGWTDGELRKLNMVKAEFGGRIVVG